MRRFYLFFLIVLSVSLPPPAAAQALVAQGDVWCPYNCKPDAPEPGYVIDVLHAVLDRNGIAFKYEIVPWTRTLLQVREGKASIAIGATQPEALEYGFLIGRETIGEASDCVFVAASSKMKFAKADDLDALNAVGISAGYTYSEDIAAWLDRPANKGKIQAQMGENPGEINARNLALGRLDGMIEDEHVMQHLIAKLGIERKVALAGCGKKTPVYIAFSAKLANGPRLVKMMDDGLADLRQSKQLARILAKYGLSDWK